MISALLHLLRLCPFFYGGHRQLALENLALRQQLAVYKRTASRPNLRRRERFFWVCLSRVWAGWRTALVIVTPDTVLRWRRRRFRLYWTNLFRPAYWWPPARQPRDQGSCQANG
jgi:putative transposase